MLLMKKCYIIYIMERISRKIKLVCGKMHCFYGAFGLEVTILKGKMII